jgi:predicted Rossmann-fold nucleotide-binding protein
MRVLVCGGRDYTDYESLGYHLGTLRAKHSISLIIHGGQRGADTMAGTWARENNIPVQAYMAEWTRYDKAAGPIRNQRMLDEGKPDLVVAFPGNRGTRRMVKQARDHGVDVLIVEPNGAMR